MLIQEFVQTKLDEGVTPKELTSVLGVSISMVTQYKKGHYNASLETAKKVYKDYGIALHPFGEENLKLEIQE